MGLQPSTYQVFARRNRRTEHPVRLVQAVREVRTELIKEGLLLPAEDKFLDDGDKRDAFVKEVRISLGAVSDSFTDTEIVTAARAVRKNTLKDDAEAEAALA